MRVLRNSILSAVLALIPLLVLVPISRSQTEQPSVALPFTQMDVRGERLSITIRSGDTTFTIANGAAQWTLPAGVVPQAALPLGQDILLLARQSLVGNWRAFLFMTEGRIRELSVDSELGRRLLLMHAFAAGQEMFAVVYDVEGTIASGRSANTVRDGMDLYRIAMDGERLALKQVIDKSALGGLDNAFRDIAIEGGHLVCGQSGCWRLRLVDGVMVPDEGTITPKTWSGFAQIEVFKRIGEVRALLRRDDDDRFTPPPAPDAVIYRDCPVLREGGCVDLPIGQIPSALNAAGEISFISSCSDIAAVLERDLTRLPNSGLTFFGMNNHEGRIPWGQVYVLDGLMDFIERLALRGEAFDRLRSAAKIRLQPELAPWASLAQGEASGFLSRRYSLERADILFALHLSRAARVLSRLHLIEHNNHTAAGLGRIGTDVLNMISTVETIGPDSITIRKGVRFWFDGGNAPWNFQSGWIEGLVALDRVGIDVSLRRPAATAMIRSFIATEIEPRKPDLWQYCAGRCQEGWTAADNVSANTPKWEGNKTRTSTAHVSYRAMDARAVLDAMTTWRLDGLAWFPGYARSLVERGWLYPMVGAPLAQFNERPHLHRGLVGRYGRSAIPFEIHNQIWALDQLARDMGCGSGR